MYQVTTKTQLITFFIFALLINYWQLTTLLLLLPILFVLLIYVNNRHYFRLSFRLKWFYLVMFSIFAFNTPGEHVIISTIVFKPTYEGLLMGLEQVLRIASLLALLSLILMQNSKQQLISGIYFLIQPLTYCGVDVQRFAARLWLTLHYVELQQPKADRLLLTNSISQYLTQEATEVPDMDLAIALENPPQATMDYVVIVLMALLFMVTLYLG